MYSQNCTGKANLIAQDYQSLAHRERFREVKRLAHSKMSMGKRMKCLASSGLDIAGYYRCHLDAVKARSSLRDDELSGLREVTWTGLGAVGVNGADSVALRISHGALRMEQVRRLLVSECNRLPRCEGRMRGSGRLTHGEPVRKMGDRR